MRWKLGAWRTLPDHGEKKKWQSLKQTQRALYIFAATVYPDDNLQNLKSSEGASSVSSSSICDKLNGMQDLHDCIYDLLQLPVEQQALAQQCNEKSVDELLERSLRILDICSTAKDFLSLSKENMYELQSVIRRRGIKTGLTLEGVKYLTLRKNMKKQIRKAWVNLKSMKNELIA
ncbi:unnamed protein product [Trifolium pratense]|uniref:Uncharacterized protein n=1 Tax=Trifolium pratense TaxID=57577 RepID=A0ACB0MF57_TRIPR|nr:unnamed protein product [Trifolium pratense]